MMSAGPARTRDRLDVQMEAWSSTVTGFQESGSWSEIMPNTPKEIRRR